jgi:transcriptional regulator with XRE-family HTH domain
VKAVLNVERGETFADALRSAITARGLPLDRLRDRLLRRGHSLTAATLSYWQSGRSKPERRESLAALAHLEDILEVEPGSLARLLGPPRPRGRWTVRLEDRPQMQAFWPEPDPVAEALTGVDTRWDERLTRISQHDEVFVGAHREELAFRSQQVLRAELDGPDRWVVIVHLDEHDRPLPEVRPLRGCRLGRVVQEPGAGLLVAELLFDRPLGRGETIITQHELVNCAPHPEATNYERKFRLPVRQFVLEVNFETPPVECVRYRRTDDGAEESVPVRIDAAGRVHDVALNFGPGCSGFQWKWA